MTGYASVDTAVEAIKLGAMDYLSKPLDFGRLQQMLASVRDEIERRRSVLSMERDLAKRLEFCGMIGRGPLMQDLFAHDPPAGAARAHRAITGETGTGKELVARALHRTGPRRDRRFVTVNCSAVVESLFESELFGHVRGAFTGATDNKPGLFERPTAARCSSTKSASCRSPCRPSCCACSSSARCTASARSSRGGSTCTSSPRPTATCARKSPPAGSAAISTTGSTSSRCSCRRCATAARTFRT